MELILKITAGVFLGEFVFASATTMVASVIAHGSKKKRQAFMNELQARVAKLQTKDPAEV